MRRGRARGRLAGLALAAIALSLPAGAAEAPKPVRIVSLNLCADQLLVQVADRRHIAGVTRLAARPEWSPVASMAAGLPVHNGRAEEIIGLEPDLVLTGRFSARATSTILRRLGRRVVELPVARSMDEIRRNIRQVARAVGEPARGERLVAAFDRRLAAARSAPGAGKPVAALYWFRGRTAGAGTLLGAMVDAAGFANMATRSGLGGPGASLPLELLLVRPPDALILAGTAHEPASLAVAALGHPALAHLAARRPTLRFPSRRWLCGTPAVAEAVELLAGLRRRVEEKR